MVTKQTHQLGLNRVWGEKEMQHYRDLPVHFQKAVNILSCIASYLITLLHVMSQRFGVLWTVCKNMLQWAIPCPSLHLSSTDKPHRDIHRKSWHHKKDDPFHFECHFAYRERQDGVFRRLAIHPAIYPIGQEQMKEAHLPSAKVMRLLGAGKARVRESFPLLLGTKWMDWPWELTRRDCAVIPVWVTSDTSYSFKCRERERET